MHARAQESFRSHGADIALDYTKTDPRPRSPTTTGTRLATRCEPREIVKAGKGCRLGCAFGVLAGIAYVGAFVTAGRRLYGQTDADPDSVRFPLPPRR